MKEIGSYLNVRAGAGTGHPIVGKLYSGNVVDVTSKGPEWIQVRYQGKLAYVFAKYVSVEEGGKQDGAQANKQEAEKEGPAASSDQANSAQVKPEVPKPQTPAASKTLYVNTKSLNVRASNSASSSRLGSLSQGTEISVLETKDGWHKIKYKQGEGWVSGQYCLSTKVAATGNNKLATAYADYQNYLSKDLSGVKKDGSQKSYNSAEAAVLPQLKAKLSKIDEISEKANIPREVVAGIWYREMSLQDGRYLHNGDPLGKPTTHVPKGIFFGTGQFVEAAVHALNLKRGLADQMGLTRASKDYAAMCAYCEAYNGFGYRNKGTASAYVSAGTDKYTGGMYVADGVFSSTKKDSRLGVLRIFMLMAENFPR